MSGGKRKPRGPITLFCESRRFRLAVVLVAMLPIAYFVSFGLAFRCGRHFSGTGFDVVYRPCIYLALDAPAPIRDPVRWCVRQCAGESGELNLLIYEVSRLVSASRDMETIQ